MVTNDTDASTNNDTSRANSAASSEEDLAVLQKLRKRIQELESQHECEVTTGKMKFEGRAEMTPYAYFSDASLGIVSKKQQCTRAGRILTSADLLRHVGLLPPNIVFKMSKSFAVNKEWHFRSLEGVNLVVGKQHGVICDLRAKFAAIAAEDPAVQAAQEEVDKLRAGCEQPTEAPTKQLAEVHSSEAPTGALTNTMAPVSAAEDPAATSAGETCGAHTTGLPPKPRLEEVPHSLYPVLQGQAAATQKRPELIEDVCKLRAECEPPTETPSEPPTDAQTNTTAAMDALKIAKASALDEFFQKFFLGHSKREDTGVVYSDRFYKIITGPELMVACTESEATEIVKDFGMKHTGKAENKWFLDAACFKKLVSAEEDNKELKMARWRELLRGRLRTLLKDTAKTCVEANAYFWVDSFLDDTVGQMLREECDPTKTVLLAIEAGCNFNDELVTARLIHHSKNNEPLEFELNPKLGPQRLSKQVTFKEACSESAKFMKNYEYDRTTEKIQKKKGNESQSVVPLSDTDPYLKKLAEKDSTECGEKLWYQFPTCAATHLLLTESEAGKKLLEKVLAQSSIMGEFIIQGQQRHLPSAIQSCIEENRPCFIVKYSGGAADYAAYTLEKIKDPSMRVEETGELKRHILPFEPRDTSKMFEDRSENMQNEFTGILANKARKDRELIDAFNLFYSNFPAENLDGAFALKVIDPFASAKKSRQNQHRLIRTMCIAADATVGKEFDGNRYDANRLLGAWGRHYALCQSTKRQKWRAASFAMQ